MISRWEYRVMPAHGREEDWRDPGVPHAMNRLGSEGWEFVSQLNTWPSPEQDEIVYLFRRVLELDADPSINQTFVESTDVSHGQPSPVVFIGHGRSNAWRDIKDHLSDLHGYDVQAYESGARAGHTVRDILSAALDKAAFAILVLAKEDEMASGDVRPRQNVIHELGLFQGRLGPNRAIAVVEEGVQVLSNLGGVHQIRYGHSVREALGDIVATLKREFGSTAPNIDRT